MSDLDSILQGFNPAASDQTEAQMAALGRQWAAFYRALLDGGVPLRMAGRMTERQQAATCHMILISAERRR
jgi:hypothetical protein